MCDQPIHDPALVFDAMEREVVYLLTDPDRHQPIWSVQEIGREIETTDPMMIIRPLVRAGLVHCPAEGFVFATRAAWRMVQMVGQVI
jgi:hypothetical protein